MRILAISGSLRQGSHNTSLLRAAEELLSPLDTFDLWDGLREVPPYDQDDDVEPTPPAVAALRAAVASADAVLIATPEYNSSIPGALKNALDWASRPFATNVFRNKPITATGLLRKTLVAIGREAQSRAFLSAPGIDELYSGVAIRTASAEETAARSAATAAGAGSASSS